MHIHTKFGIPEVYQSILAYRKVNRFCANKKYTKMTVQNNYKFFKDHTYQGCTLTDDTEDLTSGVCIATMLVVMMVKCKKLSMFLSTTP
jgi:hypothetical protein